MSCQTVPQPKPAKGILGMKEGGGGGVNAASTLASSSGTLVSMSSRGSCGFTQAARPMPTASATPDSMASRVPARDTKPPVTIMRIVEPAGRRL